MAGLQNNTYKEIIMKKNTILNIVLMLTMLLGTIANAATVPSTAVTINNRAWAELGSTLNISAAEMFFRCGLGDRACNGYTPGGVDLTGWTWANINEVNALIFDILGVEPGDNVRVDTTDWAFGRTDADEGLVFSIGFAAPTAKQFFGGSGRLAGWLITENCAPNQSSVACLRPEDTGLGYIFRASGHINTIDEGPRQPNFYNSGYFLYKDVTAVPVPAAVFLFAPALLGFMSLRRKAKIALA
jgi:hypothetical protein